ncbi:hypothetical protein, partial [Pseudomonas aeruginosa]|uniref:hypothetical protein n=1 Tax=Pseudomonas aeruginosa TaxID=287 RepID=UPI001A9F4BE8
ILINSATFFPVLSLAFLGRRPAETAYLQVLEKFIHRPPWAKHSYAGNLAGRTDVFSMFSG